MPLFRKQNIDANIIVFVSHNITGMISFIQYKLRLNMMLEALFKNERRSQTLLLAFSFVTYVFSLVSLIVTAFLILGNNLVSWCVSLILGGIFVYKFFHSWHSNPIESEKPVGSSGGTSESHRIKIPFRVSDEDKIIFNHLFDRHKNLLSYVDVLDTKVAQVIALNGVILSFVFFRAGEATSKNVYIYGLFLILTSIVIGILGYAPRSFYVGASTKFFEDSESFRDGEAMKKLKHQLLLDINRNEKAQKFKANILSYMLVFLIIGLFTLVVGYYA